MVMPMYTQVKHKVKTFYFEKKDWDCVYGEHGHSIHEAYPASRIWRCRTCILKYTLGNIIDTLPQISTVFVNVTLQSRGIPLRICKTGTVFTAVFEHKGYTAHVPTDNDEYMAYARHVQGYLDGYTRQTLRALISFLYKRVCILGKTFKTALCHKTIRKDTLVRNTREVCPYMCVPYPVSIYTGDIYD